jgi:hypothetical protein
MPMLYFKCSCGNEQHKIAPIDRTGYKQMPNGAWRFDPDAPKVELTPNTVECTACGGTIIETPDPKAVKSFLKLNWLEM